MTTMKNIIFNKETCLKDVVDNNTQAFIIEKYHISKQRTWWKIQV